MTAFTQDNAIVKQSVCCGEGIWNNKFQAEVPEASHPCPPSREPGDNYLLHFLLQISLKRVQDV